MELALLIWTVSSVTHFATILPRQVTISNLSCIMVCSSVICR